MSYVFWVSDTAEHKKGFDGSLLNHRIRNWPEVGRFKRWEMSGILPDHQRSNPRVIFDSNDRLGSILLWSLTIPERPYSYFWSDRLYCWGDNAPCSTN